MKRLYAIMDLAAPSILGGVHVFPSDVAAMRFFRDLVGDPQTMMGRHPKDHNLICIASLDEESGELLTEDFPQTVITGTAMAESIRVAREAEANQQ